MSLSCKVFVLINLLVHAENVSEVNAQRRSHHVQTNGSDDKIWDHTENKHIWNCN